MIPPLSILIHRNNSLNICVNSPAIYIFAQTFSTYFDVNNFGAFRQGKRPQLKKFRGTQIVTFPYTRFTLPPPLPLVLCPCKSEVSPYGADGEGHTHAIA